MNRKTLLQEKRSDILKIAQKYGAKNIRIFGSVAREEESETSDIDFLIEMEKTRSLFDYIALGHDLENLLGYKVDLAQPHTLHPLIKNEIMVEAIPL